MGRPLRIEYEGAVYHIIARGNEKKDIFLDKKDFRKFLYYLGLVHERYKIIVYSYVLMNNHYHLLIETPEAKLSHMMRDLNGHYTIYFNRRYNRAGHLFQGRYKAFLVEKDNYLLELSRYIHLNPVRRRTIDLPENYPYSSMRYYIKGTVPVWLNIGFILDQFGQSLDQKRKQYKKFVYDRIDGEKTFVGKVYMSSILGTEEFIEEIRGQFLRQKEISKEVPRAKQLRYGKSFDDIARVVTEYYKEDKEILYKRKVRENTAKKVFVYLMRKYTDANLKQLSMYLHNSITDIAVSKIFSRMEEDLRKDKRLRKEVENITKKLFG